MKTIRSALLAVSILAGIPSLAFAQPPEFGGRGDRSNGPGRFERGANPQGGPSTGQPRPQFGTRQQDGGRQNFGDRRDLRDGRPDQAQSPVVTQDQARQGFGRDPSRFGQNQPGGFDRSPGNDGRLDPRRGDGRRPDFNGDNRFRGDNGFGNNNRFRGGDNRFDNNNRYSGGNRFQPDWRNDRRYDWRGYRNNNRQLFRAPRYLPPRGYGFGYRPFARGYQLQPFFYGQNYWINDPWQYRLPPAYGPYRWVHYYNDVLLIDINSGFVVDVIQNFFWR